MLKHTKFLALISAAVLVLSLSGCSAKEAAYDTAAYAPETEAAYEYASNYAVGNGAVDAASLAAESTAAVSEETAPSAEYERKIVRNGNLTMQADDARECYSQLLDYAKSLGGYESSCTVNSHEYDYTTYVNLDAVIKLPPEQLDAFMNKAGEIGTVTYSSITSDEITSEYYDVKTRLDSQTKALESYYALLEKAETVEDIITIQTRIDDLTANIESLKGMIKLYDSMVDESTVNLSVVQNTAITPPASEFEWNSLDPATVGKLIKRGFLGVTNFLWSLLQWLFIIIVSALPLLVIGGGIFWLIRFLRKRRKAKNSNAADSKDDPASDNPSAPSYNTSEHEDKEEN